MKKIEIFRKKKEASPIIDRKKKIFYARTYRRIHIDWVKSTIFAALLMIPSVLICILMIDNMTELLAGIGVDILSKVIPEESLQIVTTEYSVLNSMNYIELPTTYPAFPMIAWNLGICLFTLLMMLVFKKTGKPLAIFSMFAIFTHVVSCIYFLLAASEFPYSLRIYSDLYLKQQIGIWLIFIILAGMIVAFMGERSYLFKLLTFFDIMAYSIVFGSVRYILFLYILYRYSVLYMALLFFVVGPMFDYSYFVALYAVFVNKTIKDYQYGEKKGVWRWS